MARPVKRLSFPPGERVNIEPRGGGIATLVRAGSRERVGDLHYECTGGTLTITALQVDAAHRGYGIGSEAARLLTRGATDAGFTTLHALAPGHLGLSVYFWTRMGFRPLHGEAPKEGIWFERRLVP